MPDADLKKIKAIVAMNSPGADIELELTAEQSVALLECMYNGLPVWINLKTPSNGHKPVENPAAYAQ